MSAGRGHFDASNAADDAVSCAIRSLEGLLTQHPKQPQVEAALETLWSAWHHARHGAETDALTQLPNRACFEHAIERGITRAKAHFSRIVLMFLDLDGFKKVNDLYGHQAGDDLLNTVAKRILSSVRDGDLVARYGGDEFVVMLEEPCTPRIADMIAARIVEAINLPYAVGPVPLSLSISVGVALFPDHAKTAVDLIRRADIAMYRAKSRGGLRYLVYDSSFEREPESGITACVAAPPDAGPKPKNYSGA